MHLFASQADEEILAGPAADCVAGLGPEPIWRPRGAKPSEIDKIASPIGRTAKGELVYSMKCDNLPAPPAAAQPQAEVREKRRRRSRRFDGAAFSAGLTTEGSLTNRSGFPCETPLSAGMVLASCTARLQWVLRNSVYQPPREDFDEPINCPRRRLHVPGPF